MTRKCFQTSALRIYIPDCSTSAIKVCDSNKDCTEEPSNETSIKTLNNLIRLNISNNKHS